MTEDLATTRAPRVTGRERTMLIALIAIGALALLFFLLTRGGDEPGEQIAIPPSSPTPSASPSRIASPIPETDEDFDARDPFQPLVTDQPADPGGGPLPEPSDAPVDDGSGEVRRVALLDIFRDEGELRATVSVDDDEYTVAEGETFADNFRLLDLTNECGTFVFGDERFTLCIGDEVSK